MNIHKRESALIELIDYKLRLGTPTQGWDDGKANVVQVKAYELLRIGITRKIASYILEELAVAKRILMSSVGEYLEIWTTPEYWANTAPSIGVIDFERKTRTLLYGPHRIPIRGKVAVGTCAEVVSRSKLSQGAFVDEDDILDEIFNETDTATPRYRRSIRDAVIRLNRHIEKSVGKKDFFIYQNGKIRMNV